MPIRWQTWLLTMTLLLASCAALAAQQPAMVTGNKGQSPAVNGTATRNGVAPQLEPLKLGAANAGPQVKNPRGSQLDPAVANLLQKQRKVADAEAGRIGIVNGAAVQAGKPGAQSQLLSAPERAASGSNAPLLKPSPGNLGPEQISSSGGNASNNGVANGSHSADQDRSKTKSGMPAQVAQVHGINTTLLTCSTNNTFRILTVSGSAGPATFTPIEQYNLYTITGCSFGDPGPNDKVSIYGPGSFQANFNIKFWSDNSIVVALDPALSGYPDMGNLNLVVQRNDRRQVQKGGFNFYAARQSLLLHKVPQSWVTLPKIASNSKTLVPQYCSPVSPCPQLSSQAAGTDARSLYVSRFFPGEKFDPATKSDVLVHSKVDNHKTVKGLFDYYDFSQLAAGWTTDSFQLLTYDQNCPYTVTYRQNFGTWSAFWDGDNIVVTIADTTCTGFFAGMPLTHYENWTGSHYAINVWVSGPRGTNPLSGVAAQ